jgi:nucleoid DNA-binding protein
MSPKTHGKSKSIGLSVIIEDILTPLQSNSIGTKITPNELKYLVKLFFDVLRLHIMSGQKITIPGFGTFSTSLRKGRTMIQKGGKVIKVGDYKIIKFKASGVVKSVINGRSVAPSIITPLNFNLAQTFRRRKIKKAPETVQISDVLEQSKQIIKTRAARKQS